MTNSVTRQLPAVRDVRKPDKLVNMQFDVDFWTRAARLERSSKRQKAPPGRGQIRYVVKRERATGSMMVSSADRHGYQPASSSRRPNIHHVFSPSGSESPFSSTNSLRGGPNRTNPTTRSNLDSQSGAYGVPDNHTNPDAMSDFAEVLESSTGQLPAPKHGNATARLIEGELRDDIVDQTLFYPVPTETYFDLDIEEYYANGNNACGFIPGVPVILSNFSISDMGESSTSDSGTQSGSASVENRYIVRSIKHLRSLSQQANLKLFREGPVPATPRSEYDMKDVDDRRREVALLTHHFVEVMSPWLVHGWSVQESQSLTRVGWTSLILTLFSLACCLSRHCITQCCVLQ